MRFLKKVANGDPDAPSTPRAPKIGKIPLPEVEDVKGDVVELEYDGDQGSFGNDRLPPSPVSPIHRKRKGSTLLSRSSPPQPRCASQASSSSYPRTPHDTTQTIVAPTPRWKVGETLREHGWRHYTNTPCDDRPETTKPGWEKEQRTSSRAGPTPETRAPQPTVTPLLSSPEERAPRPRADIVKEERRTSADAKRRRREPSPVPRPIMAAPPTTHPPERALALEHGTAKRPLKGILKPTLKVVSADPVYLHWQLLPYDPMRCKKFLIFDVARSVSNIRDHSRTPPVALTTSDFDKAAANVPLTTMRMQCKQLPHWEIVVHNPVGITCRNVYDEIHATLNTRLTESERKRYVTDVSRDRVLEAFNKRCRDTPELDEYTRQRGMMRVDLLEGSRIFMGLRRPVDSDDYWLLDFGRPHY